MSESAYRECETFLRRLPDLVDREHDPADEPALHAHLTQCEHCAELFQFERRFLDDIRHSLARAELPTSLRQRIGAMFSAASEPGDAGG
ncbi:MAG: anti-sigma factor [Gemmatimonadales bacterium]